MPKHRSPIEFAGVSRVTDMLVVHFKDGERQPRSCLAALTDQKQLILFKSFQETDKQGDGMFFMAPRAVEAAVLQKLGYAAKEPTAPASRDEPVEQI